MSKNPALSLRVQWLGERLRAARKEAGYKLEDAADYLQLSTNTLSRFERGTMRVRRSYIRDLVDFYAITRQRERDALFQLAEDAWRRDWWDGDTSDLEMEFIDHSWLEARASRICLFEPTLISGLVQTRPYAKAIISQVPKLEDSQIERTVELRMARQNILKSEEPTRLTLVMEEAPLRRLTGGLHVMKKQLEHLLQASSEPNIEIRILPTDLGWHPGLNGPFTFFDMPDPYPDVAYAEDLTGRTFLEETSKVDRYRQAYDELHKLALTTKESAAHIKRVLEEMH